MTAILGAGAFGAALAVALSGTQPVTLWGRRLPEGRVMTRLPGVSLPEAVALTDDLGAALDGQDRVILALPAQALRGFLAQEGARLDGRWLINTAKGIDLSTGESPSALIRAACPQARIATLTGPSFAADIARGLPTALTLASEAEGIAALQHALSTPVLRIYRSDDLRGAEMGGALKNVVAIAAGVAIGAGFGDSARAALITRGFAEMVRLATTLGARAETLAGLSGLGDLILTSTSELSRNFRYGRALGAGEDFDSSLTVEGAATARAVAALAARLKTPMPIADSVAALAEGRAGVAEVMETLMSRPLKEE
ncbi:MAG TPA: NAD(P)H-dependent glycerol-3-phosphate dehydrogenase [Paracoccus sp. (in: a-proteobacteria)]|uniref:NAD(P)H-dependent glycerol-3-phosphate dehydrogenase n=1 Tax=uncultured Paracoccus sp. TaxID=189685 RepID=UPI002638A8BC|nr:NAD(P)H-dependent glycerol-3-phosphate dehydrogenase [uncultured Paracoccus sp.]HMQ41352.1 NAD(P)H-dependent glycerol-3-phosphate dehydrogenase [Paracoccus sp. (in: a-proteobacteria)]HMR36902.1 NAD(P)H-dependent glycerol-3-phosphate dehydrogenase [Paracoccus sp. (in: a-proteobacteria)]